MRIKPIETKYKGYRFRSRLEARWAVFFDSLNVKYVYEPEGFVLADGTFYLPDFYLCDLNMFVEVKGVMTERDNHKIDLFSEEYNILTVGEIPCPDKLERCGFVESHQELIYNVDRPYYFCQCKYCGAIGVEFRGWAGRICCCEENRKGKSKNYNADSPFLIRAYGNARSARFEHGENPKIHRRKHVEEDRWDGVRFTSEVKLSGLKPIGFVESDRVGCECPNRELIYGVRRSGKKGYTLNVYCEHCGRLIYQGTKEYVRKVKYQYYLKYKESLTLD